LKGVVAPLCDVTTYDCQSFGLISLEERSPKVVPFEIFFVIEISAFKTDSKFYFINVPIFANDFKKLSTIVHPCEKKERKGPTIMGEGGTLNVF
jgi:hypothetical protein